MQPTTAEVEHLRRRASSDSIGCKILLAIGNESVSKELSLRLIDRGHEVTRVKTCAAFLAHLRSHPVDLVVVDPEVPCGHNDEPPNAEDTKDFRQPASIVLTRQQNVALERFGIRVAFEFFEPFDAAVIAECVQDCLSWQFESCYCG